MKKLRRVEVVIKRRVIVAAVAAGTVNVSDPRRARWKPAGCKQYVKPVTALSDRIASTWLVAALLERASCRPYAKRVQPRCSA